ncbi:gliding motility-associated C-terminal domain-containing protein [Mucilaginibacter sp. SMC90]|uniref:T9SS type B sorting domain-containing protein n=1 Tax=Mucilaginibacter sp. SMC90 TaxID=2929803 RepID=UPI001FB36F7E|nr:gliding motility-associated C-terminal domain-containing protein [Mucilaginibacter sp. SMC90]UOE48448.1 gliding motility-associated C-terminal domain-containing protein [Mucilaginibacter sp. SMC90]
MTVINTTTKTISATIEIGFNLIDIAISPDGKKLYVTNSGNNTVTAINTSNNTIAATIQVGNLPLGLCFSVDGSKVYVINDLSGTISVINTSNNTVSTLTGFPLSDSHTFGKFISTTSNCPPVPIKYTITVNPSPPPAVTTAGNLSPLTTVYGTESATASFTVSGTNLVSGILITPPAGFELSADGINFGGSITIGSTGTITNATVFVRLAKTTQTGNYAGNITLNAGITPASIILPTSTVTPAPLVITANNKSKPFGLNNPPLTVVYSGFVNNDQASDLTTQPVITTIALTTSPIGVYPIIASGASSSNYTFTYVPGELTITPADIIIPNTFTPNGDGANDTWAIKYIEYYPQCKVNVFNRLGTRIFSSIGYSVPWNGRLKGNDLPSGAYYYIISVKNNSPVKSGWVTIIR